MENMTLQTIQRSSTDEEWLREFGSGSLRRAREEQMAWHEFYLHERIAMEIGTGFELVHLTRLNLGKPMAFPDCRATTETCWYARSLRRRFELNNIEAKVIVHYITIDEDTPRRGLGITLKFLEKNPIWGWLPQDRILLAIVAEEHNGQYKEPINPL